MKKKYIAGLVASALGFYTMGRGCGSLEEYSYSPEPGVYISVGQNGGGLCRQVESLYSLITGNASGREEGERSYVKVDRTESGSSVSVYFENRKKGSRPATPEDIREANEKIRAIGENYKKSVEEKIKNMKGYYRR